MEAAASASSSKRRSATKPRTTASRCTRHQPAAHRHGGIDPGHGHLGGGRGLKARRPDIEHREIRHHQTEQAHARDDDHAYHACCARAHGVVQVVDGHMAAKAQHQAGAQKGAPDHQVTRHLLGPDDGVARGVAQHHVGKHDAGHGQQQHDEQPAIAGHQGAFHAIEHMRVGRPGRAAFDGVKQKKPRAVPGGLQDTNDQGFTAAMASSVFCPNLLAYCL